MRILTPLEQRQIEQLKNKIASNDITGIDCYNRDDNLVQDFSFPKDREMWLNCLQMILQTQEALKTARNRSPNPQIDFIQTGKAEK